GETEAGHRGLMTLTALARNPPCRCGVRHCLAPPKHRCRGAAEARRYRRARVLARDGEDREQSGNKPALPRGPGFVETLADDVLDGIDRIRNAAGDAFEPTLRLGVTGLSGAGKSVFITALVASLLSRERLRRMPAAAEGRITGAVLRPQPDPNVPRFPYETHRALLQGRPPEWPVSTRAVSQVRIALRVRPTGFADALFGMLSEPLLGPRTLNLDVTDYPGEWLLDLPLIEQDYEQWAAEALAATTNAARAPHAADWQQMLSGIEAGAAHDEAVAARLAAGYRDYLVRCRKAGLSALAPGRFLMPGDYEGSPALSFAPLPRPESGAGRRSSTLWGQMRARFEAYQRLIAKPFFRNHFARLDRQVVLVDALQALELGPEALADMTSAMAETLACFRHGRSSWLDRLMGGRKIDRVLFAASKADLLHHAQHPRLTALVEAMLAEAAQRASFGGASVRGMAVAAIRATSEQDVDRGGQTLALVRGHDATGREMALFPGTLPEDPGELLRGGWRPDAGASFARVSFRPPEWGSGGPPHIRLDAALDWLIGDRL
ncbi:MAG: YcjX family protein, partial [Pseudomonadota bacterium]